MGRDRVALFAAVREDHRRGMGIRAITLKHGVHRRTVREALALTRPLHMSAHEGSADPAGYGVAGLGLEARDGWLVSPC